MQAEMSNISLMLYKLFYYYSHGFDFESLMYNEVDLVLLLGMQSMERA